MIGHGRAICMAKNPKCNLCPLANICPSAFKFPRFKNFNNRFKPDSNQLMN
ncbi:MAG: hypothetical protein HYT98_05250 [Candidatus Sungbacteria bacterium]|nr:hypothetical protein [Candidatus Sungbacteria bacterium]